MTAAAPLRRGFAFELQIVGSGSPAAAMSSILPEPNKPKLIVAVAVERDEEGELQLVFGPESALASFEA